MLTVTAGLLVRDDEVLIAKRDGNTQLCSKWEFPGGKLKPDESPEACLCRELKEELNIKVRVVQFFDQSVYEYDQGAIKLLGYYVEWVDGDIKLKVHTDVKWARINSLPEYEFMPADLPFVRKLVAKKGVVSP